MTQLTSDVLITVEFERAVLFSSCVHMLQVSRVFTVDCTDQLAILSRAQAIHSYSVRMCSMCAAGTPRLLARVLGTHVEDEGAGTASATARTLELDSIRCAFLFHSLFFHSFFLSSFLLAIFE